MVLNMSEYIHTLSLNKAIRIESPEGIPEIQICHLEFGKPIFIEGFVSTSFNHMNSFKEKVPNNIWTIVINELMKQKDKISNYNWQQIEYILFKMI